MIAQDHDRCKTEPVKASVPFMLTSVNKRRLQRLGYSEEQIRNTKPRDALGILAPADSWDRLLAHLGRGGSFSLWTFKDSTGRWRESPAQAWPIGNPKPLPAEIDVWFTPNPLVGGNRGVDNTTALNCLYADFDAKDYEQSKAAILQHLETLPVYPNVVIDSGGGYHCYWLLEDTFPISSPEARQVAKDTQAGWVTLVGSDKGVKDIAHVLRVPGTLNAKYDPPREVKIDYANFEQLPQFVELYALLPEGKPEQSEPQTSTPQRKTSTDGSGKGGGDLDLWELAMRADAMDYSNPHWTDDTVTRYLQKRPRFARLWGGDLGDYRKANGDIDHSRADFALMNDLNYGTRGDEAQAWRLFGSWAGFGTEKHKRPDYWDQAWAKVSRRSVYRPYLQPRQQQTSDASDLDSQLARLHKTDLGHGERLARRFGDSLRYVRAWGWLAYNGAAWEQSDARAQQAAKQTVRAIYREAATLDDADQRAAHAKCATRSESKQRIDALLAMGGSEPQIYAEPDDFDQTAMLLNLPNGTLDLQTNELRQHSPSDMLTKTAGAIYEPEAVCPQWESFLDDVMAGNADLIDFIQRAMGYSLTGSTEEQCLFFLYGTGANGKSTFAEVLLALLGDYGTKTRTESLLTRRFDGGPNNDIAALAGARLVIAAEVPEGRRLNENLIKDLTGGDTISARFMRKEFFTFSPIFKLWMYGNHKPQIRGTDDGIWRRLRLIPFEVQIPEPDQDRQLKHRLLAELPGILNWALEGLRSWQETGLRPPQEVLDATSGYRAEMDTLQAFIDECCVAGNPNVSVLMQELYPAYQEWATESGEDSITKRRFGQRLTEKGYPPSRGHANRPDRKGIALIADLDPNVSGQYTP